MTFLLPVKTMIFEDFYYIILFYKSNLSRLHIRIFTHFNFFFFTYL